MLYYVLCRIAQHLTKHFNKKISKNRLTCLHKDDNIFLAESTWRDVRVVEGARLESVYTGNCIKGSNPFLSARKNAEFISAFFVYAIPQNTGQNCDCVVLPIFFLLILLRSSHILVCLKCHRGVKPFLPFFCRLFFACVQ